MSSYAPSPPVIVESLSAGEKMLVLIRKSYPEYHPILAIAHIAHKTQDERVELSCHQTIAKYVQPELRSIEIRAKVETQKRVIVELFDPSLIAGPNRAPMAQADVLDVIARQAVEVALHDESDEGSGL